MSGSTPWLPTHWRTGTGSCGSSRGGGLVWLRAFGPYRPEAGHLFNPAKLLLDPCAREIVGRFAWKPEHHGYVVGGPQGLREPDPRDNGAFALKARVAAPDAPAAGDGNRSRPPRPA